jgi:hypothetical protein
LRERQTRSAISFGLEAVDERLGEGIVVGITDRSDRGEHAVVGERLGVVDARVLAASVGVVDQLDVGAGAAPVKRHSQRVEDEVGAHVRGELPADDHPAVGVEHEGEEDQALPATQVERKRPRLRAFT